MLNFVNLSRLLICCFFCRYTCPSNYPVASCLSKVLVELTVFLSVWLSVHQSKCLAIFSAVCLSTSFPVDTSFHQIISPHVVRTTCLSTQLFSYLDIHVTVSPSLGRHLPFASVINNSHIDCKHYSHSRRAIEDIITQHSVSCHYPSQSLFVNSFLFHFCRVFLVILFIC